ncbi:MAG: heme-binding domain-containing protein [Stellaceae bacterium]
MKAGAKAGLGVLAIAIGLAQFVSVDRSNSRPDAAGEFPAPPAVAAILERACYDCHSNQTRWPWYARLAPVSWIAAHHVAAGRRQLNFSEWGGYYAVTRRHKLAWMARALHDEQMPPWYYRAIHPKARLSAGDRAVLARWIEAAQAGLSDSVKGQ